jgi:hypothetical protein
MNSYLRGRPRHERHAEAAERLVAIEDLWTGAGAGDTATDDGADAFQYLRRSLTGDGVMSRCCPASMGARTRKSG